MPLLSIIIPTKDRYETLIPVIETILKINSKDFELVIQDNSEDTSKIDLFLERVKDVRLKYFHLTERLSQTGNSDKAVLNSTGDFVCFIGDDDGVMPYIVDVVRWMKENNTLILKGVKPHYSWPGMPTTSTSGSKNGVLVNNKHYTYINKKIRSNDALNFTLSKGGTSMKLMPCLYHGIVARKVLQKIYKQCGTFFPGPSPDMANAVALTQVENFYVLVNIPIVISGKSNSSIGGQGVKHNHVNHIDNVAHLPLETSKNWNDIIPKYWTGPTIWAESALKSLEAFDNGKKININYLLATIYVYHAKHRKQIFEDYKWNAFKWYKFVFAYLDQIIIRSKTFFYNRVYSSKEVIHNDVSSIELASNLVVSSLDKNKIKKMFGIYL